MSRQLRLDLVLSRVVQEARVILNELGLLAMEGGERQSLRIVRRGGWAEPQLPNNGFCGQSCS